MTEIEISQEAIDAEILPEVDRFEVTDTDRALSPEEVDALDIDALESDAILEELSLEVSIKLLRRLGLEQYNRLFSDKKVGILELRGLDDVALEALGMKNVLHRARIIQAVELDKGSNTLRLDPPLTYSKEKDNKADPVEVRVKLGFARLSEIRTVDGTAKVKLFIDLYWNDPRLIGVEPEKLGTIGMKEFLWHPDLYIYNSIDRTGENGGRINEHPVSLMNPKTGLLLYPIEVELMISMQMNLRNFPFDENIIKLNLLQSEDMSVDDFVLHPSLDPKSSLKFFYDVKATPEFDIVGYSLDPYTGIGGNGVHYCNFDVHLHIRRRPSYYIWKTVMPLVFTTIFSFTCFFFDIFELEARSNTAQTTLLTTVALLFVLAQELPKTNYLTRIDKFLLFCLTLQLYVAGSNLFYTRYQESGPNIVEAVEDFDYYSAWVCVGSFILVTFLSFAPGIFKSSRKNEYTPPEKKPKGFRGRNIFG
eukprot:snap_masked-scaffold_4-processed-gene-14.13-mRNA-1 protein AED:1.00 eAED:1.00 QI:0/0/0/0/1/1/2/0/476